MTKDQLQSNVVANPEIWEDMIGYEQYYSISNHGRVLGKQKECNHVSGTAIKKAKFLKPSLNKNGYLYIITCVNNLKIGHSIHRLVAKQYLENHPDKKEVNHKDGNKKNNHWSNLEWCTSSENKIHCHKMGLRTIHCGEKCIKSKLKENDILEIFRLVSNGMTQRDVSRLFNIDSGGVCKIIKRKSWKHVVIPESYLR